MKETNKKYNYVYKIINNINGHFYIGKRSCNCEIEYDSYMGSGVALNKAYKKYGIENFTKIILSTHDTWQLAYEEEGRLVTKDLINESCCYNMKTGGLYNDCAFTQETKDKISDSIKVLHNDPEYKKRNQSALKNATIAAQTPEAKEKRRQSNLKWYKENHIYKVYPDYQVLPGPHDAYSFWVATDLSTGEQQLSFNSFREFSYNGKSLTTAIHSELKTKYGNLNKLKKIHDGITIDVYRPRFGTTFRIEKYPRFVHI